MWSQDWCVCLYNFNLIWHLSEIEEKICTRIKITMSWIISKRSAEASLIPWQCIVHLESCCQFLHSKTRCSGKNLISLTIRRWIHRIYWRTSLPEYWIKGYCSLQLLLCRQALMQEMKDYSLHKHECGWKKKQTQWNKGDEPQSDFHYIKIKDLTEDGWLGRLWYSFGEWW